MKKVGIDREWRFAALVFRNRNLVLLSEFKKRFAAFECPIFISVNNDIFCKFGSNTGNIA